MLEILDKLTRKPQGLHEQLENVFKQMFENTCQAIEQLDDQTFVEQTWTRNDNAGWVVGNNRPNMVYVDRALQGGSVFEKVGVNYVAIEGEMPAGMTFQKTGALVTADADQVTGEKGASYFATGTSFVIHPRNPMVPIAHVNYRYFQIGDGTQPGYWWFGGGADLTPVYLFEEDAIHFHRIHKDVCDKHSSSYYPRFKAGCDAYFRIPHRGENRGVGGIFFDHLNDRSVQELLTFVKDCTEAFIPAYMPLVERRKDMAFTPENKHWQHLVRGRYVEFILTSDRGMRFGIESGMVNTQSVFNCMPPAVCWQYNDQPDSGSQEALLKEVLRNPREWL
ncbi:oxygen-dependent coproporphyrinogen oxidase [Oculatella sp. LEGE 06141]|uniref:oxygen-dependent coproporphyrinogen oxidase n=1 Tax=Oculatella sp. LEGE 06141 TaxID=1828648 RepID=UPI0018809ED3|nr:oxygen-dependent coproporphyrinogen oxidase [Oculatella sp. LEGE 06141]MBE9181929.1 oxygen-dependent coproporphyrinogen oxidase [Oculatella sp. LEGE 06141]